MAGIVERIGSLAGTELAKAVNLAHSHYTTRMSVHGHTGRAIIETVAEVARNHPNLVGIGVGLLVEQLLVEERRIHNAHVAAETAAPHPAVDPVTGDLIPAPVEVDPVTGEPIHPPASEGAITGPASTPMDPSHPAHPDNHLHLPQIHAPHLRISTLKPGKIAWEVFGALLALKLGAFGARLFRRNHTEVWFAPAARIHLISGTIATYYFVKSVASPKLSAWRNAAVALFGTDALKPVLNHKVKR